MWRRGPGACAIAAAAAGGDSGGGVRVYVCVWGTEEFSYYNQVSKNRLRGTC